MPPRVRLDQKIRERFSLSWGKARSHIATGKVFVAGQAVTDPGYPVDPAEPIELRMNTPRASVSKSEEWDFRIVYSDTQLAVVSKPSGLSSVAYEGEREATLERLVARRLRQATVTVVQRLDRETSGLIVFARTSEAARKLANQFRFHTVHRRYLALVHGVPAQTTFRSLLVENRGDGIRGSLPRGASKDSGKEAVTHLEVLRDFGGHSLIQCRLETGRTHQIRIHLSEAGHPLLGEKVYVRDFLGTLIEAPRLMLHAAELGFVHPTRNVPVHWSEPVPPDFAELIADASG